MMKLILLLVGEEESVGLISAVYSQRYYAKKFLEHVQDRNRAHVPKFFLHNISGNKLQRWDQHSPLHRPIIRSTSSYSFDDFVASYFQNVEDII